MHKVIVSLVLIFVSTFLLGQTKKEESNKVINLGIKQYNNGDIMGAIASFTKSIRLDPTNYLAYYNRGLSKSALKDYNGAIIDCDAAIENNPKDPNSYNIRGLAYLGLGKMEEALENFNKAISLEANLEVKSFSPYFNRGLVYYNNKEYVLAIESYTNSINLNQEHEQSYQNRGLCYMSLEEYDKAIVDFSQAIYMNPKNESHYLNRGSAKTNKGDFEGAILDFNQAIDLNPKSTIAYYNLGVCYSNINDLRMACNSWMKSLDLGNKDAKNALENADCLTHDDVENNVISENATFFNENTHLEIKKISETEIREYLNDNIDNLDPIEGIWSANITTVVDNSTKKEMTNYAKVAIIKDTENDMRDFIMVMLEGKKFTPYTIIAEYVNTAYPRVYLSQQYDRDGSKESWNFTIDNLGLLSANKNRIEGGSQVYEELYYVKVFPRGKPLPSKSTKNTSNKVHSTGTGFVLSTNGIFATNAHVIADASRFTITIMNQDNEKKTYNAKTLFKDAINDVAIISIDDSSFTKLPRIPYNINENHSVGEKIFTIGYPLTSQMGESFKLTDGIISSLSGAKDDIRFMQITAPLQPGNSGGPLFNKDGDVIGITSARLSGKAMGTDVQNVNYALKITYLTNLIKMIPNFQNSFSETNLQGMPLEEQVNSLKTSICLIKTY